MVKRMTKWPLLGPIGVAFIEARNLVSTPSLYDKPDQKAPDAGTVAYIHDAFADLVIGSGVTLIGMACIVVFVAAWADHIWTATGRRVAPLVMLLGVAATGGAVLIGYGMMVVLAAASEESSPATVVAVYIIQDSLGYIAWTAMGLVSGAVAAAYWRAAVAPGWIGWLSLAVTVLFVGCAFAPFLSWVPALVWVLVTGVGLLFAGRGQPVAGVTSG